MFFSKNYKSFLTQDILTVSMTYILPIMVFVQKGCTALILAARSNHIEIVELLLKLGADVNAKINVSFTSMFLFNVFQVCVLNVSLRFRMKVQLCCWPQFMGMLMWFNC